MHLNMLLRISSRLSRSSATSVQALSSSTTTTTTPPVIDTPWMDAEKKVYKYWSNNSFVTSSSAARRLAVVNPATQEVIGQIAETTADEFDVVVENAVAAYRQWKDVPVQQRQRVMLKYQHLLRNSVDDLAALITLENGKTKLDAVGDVIRGLEVVETASNVATHMLGDSLLGISTAMDTISYRQPLGVCAGICPFNFPAMIPLWMFPLAVATGNTYILKPSEKTPGATLLLAELAAQAGLPANVLQVVHGSRDTVDRICTHRDIRAVSFVGSNAAGEHIYATATSRGGKRVQANLGAKNHAVILPDADRTAVVRAVTGAAFGAAGQRCMALSTVILVGSSSSWLEDICTAAQRLTVGAGWEAGTDIGPLITVAAKQRVHDCIAKAVDQGAELWLDGRNVSVSGYPAGNFVGPTVLKVNGTDFTDNVAYTDEIFGPVLTVLTTDTLEEAMEIVNANQYGNGCALFTQSGAAARKFTAEIECGQLGINVPIPVPLPMFSFTGNKASIRGDLNFYGKSGVQFYTQLKTVTSNWPYQHHSVDLGGVTMPTLGTSRQT